MRMSYTSQMSESALLDPNDIDPPHEAHDEPLLARLVENMKRDGWERRRLLVEDITLGPDRYQGWTGSHRIEAARRAELPQVPCLVLTVEERKKAELEAIAGNVLGLAGYGSFLKLVSHGLQRNDNKGRLKALVRAGLEEAAELMQEELDSDRERGEVMEEPSN